MLHRLLLYLFRDFAFRWRVLKQTQLARGLSLYLWLYHWFFCRFFPHNLMSFSFVLLFLELIDQTSCNNCVHILIILNRYMFLNLRFIHFYMFINWRFWIFISKRFLNYRYLFCFFFFHQVIFSLINPFHRGKTNILKLYYVIFLRGFYNIFFLF